MKAVKINKIVWNLNSVDPADKEKVKKSLPTSKGFMADDDFNVPDKVPNILAKKFGYDIITFSYSEIKVIEKFEDLLLSFAPKDTKINKLFSPKGELSLLGEECYNKLLDAIARRRQLEKEGTPEDEMPKLLDKVMLSLETITGMEWDDTSEEDYKTELDNMLQDRINKYIKSAEAKKLLRKEAKKELKAEMKKMAEDDDDDEDDDEEE
jgi:hypothetical protein